MHSFFRLLFFFVFLCVFHLNEMDLCLCPIIVPVAPDYSSLSLWSLSAHSDAVFVPLFLFPFFLQNSPIILSLNESSPFFLFVLFLLLTHLFPYPPIVLSTKIIRLGNRVGKFES